MVQLSDGISSVQPVDYNWTQQQLRSVEIAGRAMPNLWAGKFKKKKRSVSGSVEQGKWSSPACSEI